MSESRPLHPVVENIWSRVSPNAYKMIGDIRDQQEKYQKGDSPLYIASAIIAHIGYKISKITNEGVEASARQARMNKYGCVELAPGESGFRPSVTSDEELIPLSTGISRFGVVCAVYHPDIGFAAAHQNTYRENDIADFVQKYLHQGRDIVSLLYGENRVSPEDMIRETTVVRVCQETLNQALYCFIPDLDQGYRGTEVSLLGLNYVSPEKTEDYVDLIRRYLNQHLQTKLGLESGKIKLIVDSMNVEAIIGQNIGLIYGGEDHPVYPKPKLFPR